MKRLLCRGGDKIFQISRCFRRNERGPRHLPEMTLLEWYAKDQSYLDLMNQCQALVAFIAKRLKRGNQIRYQGRTICIDGPWERLTVKEAFTRYTDVTMDQALQENRFDEIVSFEIEPHLGLTCPTFLHDYPAGLASLAKLVPEDPDYAQRVEFYISGIELANGFTELTDPIEQQQRFQKENRIRLLQNKPALPLPENFLRDLATMPEAAGIALGIDRLVMLFCDTPIIDHVVAFAPEDL
jgi:lysyl-tRNA synthetase class 2